jgi:hypothetical protein
MVDLLVRHGLVSGNPAALADQQIGPSQLLDEVCELISHLTQAPTVLVGRRDPEKKIIRILGKTGTLVTEVDMSFVIPALNADTLPVLICPDVRRDARFLAHPLLRLMPHVRSLIVMLVPGSDTASRAVLKIINPRRSAMNDAALISILSQLCFIICDMLKLTSEIEDARLLRLRNSSLQGSAAENFVENAPQRTDPAEGDKCAQSVARFLTDTLVNKQKLHMSDGMTFVSLLTWRKPIRKYQEQAVAELSGSPPDKLVRSVAAQIADYVRNAHGHQVMKLVAQTAVAAGGPGSLFGNAIARQVAVELNAGFVEALSAAADASLVANGLAEQSKPVPAGPLLLVDVEAPAARKLQRGLACLRASFHPVYAVIWIG